MSDVVRWGILGAALFAKEHMGPAIHAARGGILAALATRSAGKAAEFTDFKPCISGIIPGCAWSNIRPRHRLK